MNGQLVALDAISRETVYNITETGIAEFKSKWKELVNSSET
jgi:hypothetical protein